MKQSLNILTGALIIALGLAGCSSDPSKQDIGTVAGGLAGGLIGSQFGSGSGQILAIGAGALAGAFLGGAIGKNMDDTDKLKMNKTLETAPLGKPAYWQNDKTGNTYTVTPTKDLNPKKHHNEYCREYTTTAVIAGKTQNMYGTACRQPDGSWKTVSQKND